MATAVITASASVVVAAMAFALNYIGQFRLERRKFQVERVGRQLRELYGPMLALSTTNEKVWSELRRSHLPPSSVRRSSTTLGTEEASTWRTWTTSVLLPTNIQMRGLILEHADLLDGDAFPDIALEFCAHVVALEVVVREWTQGASGDLPTLIKHPGERFHQYIRESHDRLKGQQAALLKL